MINWGVSVIGTASGDPWGLFGAQPDGADQYDQLAIRLRRAGCKFLSPRELSGVMWPDTPCSITVETVDGVPCVTQMHTGASRLIPTEALELPPMFVEAIARGRVLLALFKPDTLPTYGLGKLMPAEAREHVTELTELAAERRELLAGYARVLDRPAPRPAAARGPGGRRR